MIVNALSGATAAQVALNTNSQNIANAMTPGYTRQGVLLSAVQHGGRGVNAAGAGVGVTALLRFSDTYKSLALWNSASSLGQYGASRPYLNQLEQVMSDDTANINAGLDGFFGALNAASTQPDSAPLRTQVLTEADSLVKRFANLEQLFANQQSAITEQRKALADQINGYAEDIALLNKQIAAGRAAGISTSGLEDARDLRIDSLSGLVGLQVVSAADGTRNVALKNGQPLVIGSEAGRMDLSAGVMELKFASTTFKLTGEQMGGQLGGLQDFEAQVLKPMRTTIDELAQGLAQKVNDVLTGAAPPPAHATYDANGNPGQPLFAIVGGKLGLTTPQLTADQLAFGLTTASGDSGNLQHLVDLKNQTVALTAFDAAGKPLPGTVNVVLGDVYTQLVGRLGVQSQQNIAGEKTAQTVRDQSEENWKSTAGVNTDEEAINLMQFKQMYESNMKVIAVANELFDTLLAMR